MFGLFKKKPDPREIFSDGTWQVSQGESGGSPIVVRINTRLKPFAGNTELTLKIGFALPLNSPNEGGLPDPAENQILADVEDKIADALASAGDVVQALAITTGTFKEFVFYGKPNLDIKTTHERLMSEIKSHDLQCYAEMDPNWDTYKEFAN
jgi:Family of unknown function (DUF695)